MRNPKLHNIAIIGSGTMGTGIAQVAAMNYHNVIIIDSIADNLIKSEKNLKNSLNKLVEKNKIEKSNADIIFNNVKFSIDLSCISESNLVIEAIIEDLNVKQNLFREITQLVSTSTIIASNTSSLSIASLSSSVKNPGNLIGLHFFNPVPVMQLVEVVPSILSSQDIVDEASQLMKNWGKIPVITKDTPGFIVNRIARPFIGEALRINEEGIANMPTIDKAMKEVGGFRMGPFELMDLIGNDVNYAVNETLFKEFYYDPRFRPSITQKRYVEAKLFGRKTGRGFYDYSEKGIGNWEFGIEINNELGEQIFLRIMSMLINLAADALYHNIATKEDIELAMTKGMNYPKGLFQWADEIGIDKILKILTDLFELYGEDRYRPSILLKKMGKEN